MANPAAGQTAKRLQRLLELCRSLPEATAERVGQRGEHVKLAVGRKVFAYYMNDHHGDGIICICGKAARGRQQELVARDPQRYLVPSYLGRSGWVSLRLDTPRVDWGEVFELVAGAYRLQAPRRLLDELD